MGHTITYDHTNQFYKGYLDGKNGVLCHWFVKIDKILKLMGLKTNPCDPYIYSRYIHDLDGPSNTDSSVSTTMGLYVDNFI